MLLVHTYASMCKSFSFPKPRDDLFLGYILRKMTMYVKTVTTEGTIIGGPTSSIETLILVFYSFLDLKSKFHQKDKEREREKREHNIIKFLVGDLTWK